MTPSFGWQVSAGCYQEASVLPHKELSLVLLECSNNRAADFLQRERSQKSMVDLQHLSPSRLRRHTPSFLLVSYWLHSPAIIQCGWERYKGMDTKRKESLGGQLEGCLPRMESRHGGLWSPVRLIGFRVANRTQHVYLLHGLTGIFRFPSRVMSGPQHQYLFLQTLRWMQEEA